jgi:putative membrane protein
MNLKIILVIILACLSLIFVAQNIDVVTVSFLFWDVSLSRAVLIFLSLLIGLIIGWFLHSYFSYLSGKRDSSDIDG